MSSTAPAHNPANHATQRAEDAQYHRQMLHELADMGMDIARVLHRHAIAAGDFPEGQPASHLRCAGAKRAEGAESAAPETRPAASAAAPSPAIAASAAFERIARAVGRTIALARKLTEPDRAPASKERAAAQGKQPGAQHARLRRADGANPYAHLTDAELDELDEVLDDLDGDLGEMPFADAIAMICRDLGIAQIPGTQPGKCRTLQDVLDFCALVAHLPKASTDASADESPETESTNHPKGAQPAARPLSPPPQNTRGGIHDSTQTGAGPPTP
jgi:hypothetical protein